jgi:hypothetical protein
MKYLTPALFGLILSGGLITAPSLAVPTGHSQSQQAIVAQTDSLAPASIATQQLADVLIGMMYFGLPCSCLLAVLLHHQRAAQQARLAARLVPIRIKSRY